MKVKRVRIVPALTLGVLVFVPTGVDAQCGAEVVSVGRGL